MSDKIQRQQLEEIKRQNYLTEQSWEKQVKKENEVAFSENDLKYKQLRRSVIGQSFGLTGSFLQATIALAPQGTQAQLKSSVAVVQMATKLVGIGVAAKEMFEVAAKRHQFSPQKQEQESDNTNAAPAGMRSNLTPPAA